MSPDPAWVLGRPDARIDVHGPRCWVRLARRGSATAREIRRGPDVTVELLTGAGEPGALVRACAPGLAGIGRAGAVLSVSFPTAVVLHAGCRGPDVAALLRGSGCDGASATRVARALASAHSAAEITFAVAQRRTRSVLAVLGGPDGAVLAHTAPAADGVLWTAVCEGTGYRLGAALRRGCEDLPEGGRWP